MENGPNADFEALFYSGWKMARTLNGLQITEPNGQTSTVTFKNEEPQLDRESTRDLWHHLKECLAHCERIETTVNQLAALPVSNSSLPFFPLTIGRKPPSPSSNKLSCSNKENQIAEPVLSGLKSFDGSVRSAANSSCKSSLRRLDQQKSVNITRTVEVLGIGLAIQKSSGKHNKKTIILKYLNSNVFLFVQQVTWKSISMTVHELVLLRIPTLLCSLGQNIATPKYSTPKNHYQMNFVTSSLLSLKLSNSWYRAMKTRLHRSMHLIGSRRNTFVITETYCQCNSHLCEGL